MSAGSIDAGQRAAAALRAELGEPCRLPVASLDEVLRREDATLREVVAAGAAALEGWRETEAAAARRGPAFEELRRWCRDRAAAVERVLVSAMAAERLEVVDFGGRRVVSRPSPPELIIEEEAVVPVEFGAPLDRDAIRRALAAGEDVPGAFLCPQPDRLVVEER